MTSPVLQPAPSRGRLPAVLYWSLPSLLCLVLYWFGLRAWFQKDDFAWLSLHLHVHDFRSFISAMFTPLAQGTVRPWSERLPFLAGYWLFGLESPPFRALAFATMFANLILLTAITRRITGSAAAGLLAPLLWICNGNLYIPMSWTSAYNQIQCAFFLLAALFFWIRFTASGERRHLAGTWIVFVLGFGALEINVVFPAIAILYAACFARRYLVHAAPMLAISAVYSVVHRAVAPAQVSDTYRMYFDAGIPGTLRTYITWSFGADRYAAFRGLETWPFYAAEATVALALLAFSVVCIRRGDWLPVFCAGWFLIVIAPVLPLRNHVSDYYLTVPVIGLAILGAAALVHASHTRLKFPAILIGALYVVPSAWMAYGMTGEYYRASRKVATLVRSIAYAQSRHPGDILLLRGMDPVLYGNSAWNYPAEMLASGRVYLEAPVDAKTPGRHVLANSLALQVVRQNRLQVYEVSEGGRLRNITPLARAEIERRPPQLPQYLDLRSELSAMHLGDGWWQSEPHHRWTAKRATLRLGAPSGAGQHLVLRGSYPFAGIVRMGVTINGRSCPPATLRGPSAAFDFRCPVAMQPQAPLDIAIEVNRTQRLPSDGRELGVALTSAGIEP